MGGDAVPGGPEREENVEKRCSERWFAFVAKDKRKLVPAGARYRKILKMVLYGICEYGMKNEYRVPLASMMEGASGFH